jgi:hypothetical protein
MALLVARTIVISLSSWCSNLMALPQASLRWSRASSRRWMTWRVYTGAWPLRDWRASSRAPSSVCPRLNFWSCSCPRPTAQPLSHSPVVITTSRRCAPYGGEWVSYMLAAFIFFYVFYFSFFLSLSLSVVFLSLFLSVVLLYSLFARKLSVNTDGKIQSSA